ncbi:MAG TPA: MraY family glycosyltransferase [Geothrix sp.]|nr:MraY family glycosyltransferase [Geothrix sp.]
MILVQVSGRAPIQLHVVDWAAVHVMAATGLLDDHLNLRARYKALVGLGVAITLAVHMTHSLGQATEQVAFLGMALPNHPVILVPLLLCWFWAVPQAYNLIDGINGLSLGFASLLLGVLGWNLGMRAPLMWGVLASVFLLNFPKARHFLGDCGALMMGTLFAILGVKAFALTNPDLLLWVFAYPIVDVSLVVGIRRWKGLPLGEADRSHLHHWMMDRVKGKPWIATPVLLVLAALPMLRATAIPGHAEASTLGIGILALLAFKAFKDRVTRTGLVTTPAQVRREIPFMMPSVAREPSGSHPKL